jgi:hypothetical protein
LAKLILDVSEDSLLEDLAFGEDLLHGHARDQDSGLTLDDTLDDICDMLALVDMLFRFGIRQKHSILHQSIASIFASRDVLSFIVNTAALVSTALIKIWAHCEHYRQRELQLLLCHGL